MRRSLSIAAVVLLAAVAGASKPRLRLERVDASDFASEGVVRVFASVVELEGNIDDSRGPGAFQLLIDGKSAGRAQRMQPFSGANEPLDLVLVVESSALYGPPKVVAPPPPPPPPPQVRGQRRGHPAPAPPLKGKKLPPPAARPLAPSGPEPLDRIKESLHDLLEALGARVRVLLIDYGGAVTAHAPFRAAGALAGTVDDLSPDGEAGDLALSEAMRTALLELNKPRPDGRSARRLIVVISDGLNTQMDRRTFRTLAQAAARAHVPVHTIGFSPNDERGPLLNLGELSKRTNGTFRWARTGDDLRTQIEGLADELNKQYVLTYKLELRDLEKHRFQLVSEDLTSNTFIYGENVDNTFEPAASQSWLPLWAWLGGGVLALGLIALLVRAWILRRRALATVRATYASYDQPGGQATVRNQPAPPPKSVKTKAPKSVKAKTVPPSAPAANPALRGVLILISGARAGERVSVGAQPLVIGKGDGGLQILDDPTVSTRHAELAVRGNAFVVTDLGSTNGTFVNNARLYAPAAINDGDLVRVGNTQMKFRTE